jgi:anti-anti-sigma factor
VATTPVLELLVIDGQPTVRGECDYANADRLREWLLDTGGATRAIDLSGVTFFDSSALRTFLRAVERDPRVRIVQPSSAVTRVLYATGTYDHLVDDLT